MSNKVLFFEGAGCVPRGDVENCRIRTAFVNDSGEKIYLELSGFEPHKHTPNNLKCYANIAFVDYCYILEYGEEKCRFDIVRKNFEYSKKSILDFVNECLNCSFESLIVLDMFDGYRVHKDGGGYNFIEDFEYNPEQAEKARYAFHKIDMEIREQLGEKYSKISLHSIDKHAITVRCYASNESMRSHGLDPDKRFMTVLL